jgi:hypothetical protein
MLKKYVEFLPEEEYRAKEAFSYSLLSAMDEEGPIALIERADKKSKAFDFGSYVDMILTDPNNKNKRFHTESVTPPTAMLLTLADSLIEDNKILDMPYKKIIEEDHVTDRIKSLKLWNTMVDPVKIKEKWDNKIFYDYIKETINAKGKIVLSPDTLEAADYCAKVLQTHPYTSYLFDSTDDIEILKQACILYMFKGVQGKAKLDLIRVDHKNKLISPFDIKTGSELPSKFENSFYKFKYYLQVISYLLALQFITESVPEFKDYKIDNFKFIYISKKLPDVPCVYTVNEKLLNKFADGWTTYEGKKIRGFLELVDDYVFHKTQNIYNTERKIIEKKGLLNLELL